MHLHRIIEQCYIRWFGTYVEYYYRADDIYYQISKNIKYLHLGDCLCARPPRGGPGLFGGLLPSNCEAVLAVVRPRPHILRVQKQWLRASLLSLNILVEFGCLGGLGGVSVLLLGGLRGVSVLLLVRGFRGPRLISMFGFKLYGFFLCMDFIDLG